MLAISRRALGISDSGWLFNCHMYDAVGHVVNTGAREGLFIGCEFFNCGKDMSVAGYDTASALKTDGLVLGGTLGSNNPDHNLFVDTGGHSCLIGVQFFYDARHHVS
jgi:hypothetical protein